MQGLSLRERTENDMASGTSIKKTQLSTWLDNSKEDNHKLSYTKHKNLLKILFKMTEKAVSHYRKASILWLFVVEVLFTERTIIS